VSGSATNTSANSTAARPGLQARGASSTPSHTRRFDTPEVRDSMSDQLNATITSESDSDASTSTRYLTWRRRGRRVSR